MIHVNNMDEYRNTVCYNQSKLNVDSVASSHKEAVDAVYIGDVDSERMHKMEAVNSISGKYDYLLSWRRALDGGYFMYNLKTIPSKEVFLYLVFRANDQETFAFDILVDGQIVKTFIRDKSTNRLSTRYYRELIPIPQELILGKKDITIKISAKLKEMSGDILDLCVVGK